MSTFFITPLNEGQGLNYTETYEGTESSAVLRAIDIKKALTPILHKGRIGVEVKDNTGVIIYEN